MEQSEAALGTLSDAQVIAEVEQRIDRALAANRTREFLVVIVLVVLFAVGIGLVIFAAFIRYWPLLVSGGIVELAVTVPIRRLIKLREDTIRLQIVP